VSAFLALDFINFEMRYAEFDSLNRREGSPSLPGGLVVGESDQRAPRGATNKKQLKRKSGRGNEGESHFAKM